MGQLIGVILALAIALLIAQDARKRGMNHIVWGIFTFFLLIIALPLYFIFRKPIVRNF